jgi:Rieske Fe-S protein
METQPSPSASIPETSACNAGRRSFLAKVNALLFGAVAYAVPVAAAVLAALHPLRQKGSGGTFRRLATLETLPPDGTPRKFPVVAERIDAWTRSVEPVGAVYLRRTGPSEVEALQVVCPHAGCTVEFKQITTDDGARMAGFSCPCHKAIFDATGKRLQAKSQSPRDLDTLAVEIRNDREVWVQFQSFKLGTPEKVPLS